MVVFWAMAATNVTWAQDDSAQPPVKDDPSDRDRLEDFAYALQVGCNLRYDPVILFDKLGKLATNDLLRVDAILMARMYASPAELAKSAKNPEEHSKNHSRVILAWKLLQAIGLLKEGVDLESVVALLGKPTDNFKTWDTAENAAYRWEYPSKLKRNPALVLGFKNGKIKHILVVNR